LLVAVTCPQAHGDGGDDDEKAHEGDDDGPGQGASLAMKGQLRRTLIRHRRISNPPPSLFTRGLNSSDANESVKEEIRRECYNPTAAFAAGPDRCRYCPVLGEF